MMNFGADLQVARPWLCIGIISSVWRQVAAALRCVALVTLSMLGAVAAGLSAVALCVLTFATWLLGEAIRSMSPPAPAPEASLMSAIDLEVGLISDSRADSVIDERTDVISPSVRWQAKQAPSIGIPLPRFLPMLIAMRKRSPTSLERRSMMPPSSRDAAFCFEQEAAVLSPQSWPIAAVQGMDASPFLSGEYEEGHSLVGWDAEAWDAEAWDEEGWDEEAWDEEASPTNLEQESVASGSACHSPLSQASDALSESPASPADQSGRQYKEHPEIESQEHANPGAPAPVGPSRQVLARHALVLQELQRALPQARTEVASGAGASDASEQQEGNSPATSDRLQLTLQRLSITPEQIKCQDIRSMSRKGLAVEKERVRQELDAYEQELAEQLSRPPKPEEKEEMRLVFIYYWRIKEAIANADAEADDACSIADASTEAGSVAGSFDEAFPPFLLRSQVGARLAGRIQKLKSFPDLRTSRVQHNREGPQQQRLAPPAHEAPRLQQAQAQSGARPWR